jgi:type II secretion system protein C
MFNKFIIRIPKLLKKANKVLLAIFDRVKKLLAVNQVCSYNNRMKKNFRVNLKFLNGLKKKPTTSVDDTSIIIEEVKTKTVDTLDVDKDKQDLKPEFPPKFPPIPNTFEYSTQVQKTPPPKSKTELPDIPKVAELPIPPEVIKKVRIKFPKFSKPNFSAPKLKIPKFEIPKFKIPSFKTSTISTPKFNSPLEKIQKFNWNDFVTRLFSPYSRGKIHAWFLVLIIISTTYIAGKTFALLFSKSNTVASRPSSLPLIMPNADTTGQDIGKIMSANLFNIKENEKAANVGEAKKDIASIVCTDGDKPTSLSAKLMDTVILQDTIKSVASVQMRGGEDLLNLREGEKIDNSVEISKITRQKLILKNLQTGDCEYLMADSEDNLQAPPMKILSAKEGRKLFKSVNPNIKNVGNNFKIKKAYRETMMNNMSEILTQAKALQITNPDGSLCFKMTEVVPGSLYTQLNIQENDIVCSINGKKIENLNELMGFLGKIREIDNMQIGVNRNGMTENLDYNFE